MRLKKSDLRGLLSIIKNRFINKHKEENIDIINGFQIVGKIWIEGLCVTEVENINSQLVVDRLKKEIKPDLIIDHGTSRID